MKDKKVGVNYPPMHCRCRSTTVPYFRDIAKTGERVARRSDGKSYYVPESMTYHEWYEKYVRDNPEELLAEQKLKNKASDKKQHEKYKEVLGQDVPKSFDEFQELKYNNNEWSIFEDYYRSRIKGDISAFSGLEDYKSYKVRIEGELVGVKLPNGIEVKSYSKHFVDRVLGASNDPKTGRPREGVSIENIKDALENPLQIKEEPRKGSHKIIGERATVSINPETGNLIQCNPTDNDIARRLKGV